MMNDQIDSSIPVLTEVILTPDNGVTSVIPNVAKPLPTSLFPGVPHPSANHAKPITKQVETENVEARLEVDSDEWMQLENMVRENVLRQVLSRIDFVLEHRVSDSLAEVLQTSVDNLAEEIRAGLRHSIEEVVTRALTQEISKLKNSR